MDAHVVIDSMVKLTRSRLIYYLGLSLGWGDLELAVAAYVLSLWVFHCEDCLLACFLADCDVV